MTFLLFRYRGTQGSNQCHFIRKMCRFICGMGSIKGVSAHQHTADEKKGAAARSSTSKRSAGNNHASKRAKKPKIVTLPEYVDLQKSKAAIAELNIASGGRYDRAAWLACTFMRGIQKLPSGKLVSSCITFWLTL
jgi:hypothetical protein